MKSTIEQIHSLIRQAHRCVLTTHVNPDGDGLGSELAFARFLDKLGKEASIINHSRTPDNYTWLDRSNRIINFMPEQHRDLILNADLVFIIDTNQPDRLRSLQPFVQQSNAKKIVIDHHLEPNSFA